MLYNNIFMNKVQKNCTKMILSIQYFAFTFFNWLLKYKELRKTNTTELVIKL